MHARGVPGILVALVVATGQPQAAVAQPAEPATRLEDLRVEPTLEPLDEERQRLRRLLDEQAPCLGCERRRASNRSLIAETVRYVLFPARPPNPDFTRRREYRLLNEWRIPERGPEMEAFH